MLAFVFAWLACPSAALADDGLEWVAPNECPSREEITARIERVLGHARRPADSLRAKSLVSKDVSGVFHGEVSLTVANASSVRRIDGESCDAVSDAIVLILAIAVDPEALGLSASGSEAASPSPGADRPAAIPRRARAEASEPGPFAIAAGASVDSGLLGTPTPGAELVLGLRAPRFSMDLAASWLAAETSTLTTKPSEGVSLSAGQIVGRVCGTFGGRTVTFGPCAAAGVSWIMARGFGAAYSDSHTTNVPIGSLGARVSLRLASHVALWLEADAIASMQRPSFVIDNSGDLGRLAAASARLTSAMEFRF